VHSVPVPTAYLQSWLCPKLVTTKMDVYRNAVPHMFRLVHSLLRCVSSVLVVVRCRKHCVLGPVAQFHLIPVPRPNLIPLSGEKQEYVVQGAIQQDVPRCAYQKHHVPVRVTSPKICPDLLRRTCFLGPRSHHMSLHRRSKCTPSHSCPLQLVPVFAAHHFASEY
jgi:hypothetical protein